MPEDIPDNEITEEFICSASGPGGQHVNRTASTVRLSFDFRHSVLLTDAARERLQKISPSGINGDFLIITCRESRSLTANRNTARKILCDWINLSLKEPKKRRKTKPTRASQERRLQAKSQRSQLKADRSRRYE